MSAHTAPLAGRLANQLPWPEASATGAPPAGRLDLPARKRPPRVAAAKPAVDSRKERSRT